VEVHHERIGEGVAEQRSNLGDGHVLLDAVPDEVQEGDENAVDDAFDRRLQAALSSRLEHPGTGARTPHTATATGERPLNGSLIGPCSCVCSHL
jgi:hypothetical protein